MNILLTQYEGTIIHNVLLERILVLTAVYDEFTECRIHCGLWRFSGRRHAQSVCRSWSRNIAVLIAMYISVSHSEYRGRAGM